MEKIAVLDQYTIDKIAAGEVVERPASVVKELVENSIDAGATAVTVEISDGGKKLIRITDNGGGIEYDQIPLAFLRHATSKIRKIEDLEQIASLGFRGEALSSIAAVSQVELITKTPTAVSGARYVIEGGCEMALEELGAPEGTTFLVRNLFYNTPARSKFLKSDMTEGNYISELMEHLALSHPEVSFKYIQNRQVKLHTAGNGNVKDVIYHIYGREIARSLLEISFEDRLMRIDGFAGRPEISRGNRSFENYYVNGRYVKNNLITKAVEDAYKGFLMQHKFPFVSLQIQMDGKELDVNVHPAKREVRFARGPEVYDGIFDTIRRALTGRELIPSVTVGREPKPEKRETVQRGEIPEPFETKRRQEMTGRTVEWDKAGFPGREEQPEDKKGEIPAEIERAPEQEKPLPGPSEYSVPADSLSREMREESVRLPGRESDGMLSREEERWFEGKLSERAEAAEMDSHVDKNTTEHVSGGAKSCTEPSAEPCAESDRESSSKSGTESDRESGSKSGTESGAGSREVQAEENASRQMELFQDKLLDPESRVRHQLIGQIFDTYWLVQFGDSFYIIDQHAAHEKVYYERLVKQFRERTILSQFVSPPLIVTLNIQEEAILASNQKYFQEFGFEIEHFGGKEYCISAVPSMLYGWTETGLFLDMLDQLNTEGSRDPLEIFASQLAAMACKAAVKGNRRMSPQEADRLIDELLTLENPYHCPHGRPTIISMSRAELEKKFRRIV